MAQDLKSINELELETKMSTYVVVLFSTSNEAKKATEAITNVFDKSRSQKGDASKLVAEQVVTSPVKDPPTKIISIARLAAYSVAAVDD